MESAIKLSIGGVDFLLEAWFARLVEHWLENDPALILEHGAAGPLTFSLPPPAIETGSRSDRCHCARLASVTLANPYLRIANALDAVDTPSQARFEMQRLPYLLMSQPDSLQLAVGCPLCRLWNAEEQRVHGLDTEELPVYCRLRLPFLVAQGSLQPHARLEFNHAIGRDMYMCLRGEFAG